MSYRIDEVSYVTTMPFPLPKDSLALLKASHNRLGDVSKHLMHSDDSAVILEPGDTLWLEYSAAIREMGTVREFILRTEGRYNKHDSEFASRSEDGQFSKSAKVTTLGQNSPNPFNPATTINFSLPQKAQVSLTVYNILGQQVTTLVNDELSAGEYSVTWDAAKYASGIYFYSLKTGQTRLTKKALLVK